MKEGVKKCVMRFNYVKRIQNEKKNGGGMSELDKYIAKRVEKEKQQQQSLAAPPAGVIITKGEDKQQQEDPINKQSSATETLASKVVKSPFFKDSLSKMIDAATDYALPKMKWLSP